MREEMSRFCFVIQSISKNLFWHSWSSCKLLFLPAAGYRSGSDVEGVGTHGRYLSVKVPLGHNYYDVEFSSGSLASGTRPRVRCLSVRLASVVSEDLTEVASSVPSCCWCP